MENLLKRMWRVSLVGAISSVGCASPQATETPDRCGQGASIDTTSDVCFCDPGFHGDPEFGCVEHDDLCAEAEVRQQHTVCAHTVDDAAQWTRLSIGGGPGIAGVRRLGKYLVPASPDSRLPTVFSDANSYRLHYCLMSSGFAPLFPGLTTADHARLILTKAGREFYAGAVYELQREEPPLFGFAIETAPRAEEMLSTAEVYSVYRHLADRFEPGELGYLPRGTMQQAVAASWPKAPFTVLSIDDTDVAFEAYTPGIAYGRVRANPSGESGDFSWQDIVVFDDVPVAWEGVMAAAVTGQRQDILSHLNVLSAQRGTPNIFVDDALAVFEQFEGELVRIEAAPNNYKLRLATQQEADDFWREQRPSATVENPAEFGYLELDAFASIPTATLEERRAARSRFGAKTVGLATLSQLIDPNYQTPGFGVPFHYYEAFMADNVWTADVAGGPQTLSYAETVTAWLAEEEFRSNAALRKERLSSLRDEMRARGVVSPELVDAMRATIVAEFGAETVMVRVRSSSNAEDTPTFNGAGLYDSTSACAADVLANANAETSVCDANKSPRTLERALAKVWASLWNYGAFEERDYFQLDHASIAMGATVSLRFEGETANGVAFTGSPINSKQTSFTVNAQYGEVDVVSPTPGVTAELSLLTLDAGEVTEIERALVSSLVPVGEVVVSDVHLRELGGLMAALQQTYPLDADAGSEPLLDLEFKVTSDDTLIIKQIRTFLPAPYSSDPTCR